MPETHGQLKVPVKDIELRLRWPAAPAFLFLLFMLGLGVVALIGTRSKPPILSGLPDHPGASRAAERVRGRVRLEPGLLRFGAALTGELPGGPKGIRSRSREDPEPPMAVAFSPRSPGDEQRLADAAAMLGRPHGGRVDPRLIAAQACLDLMRGRMERAERGYRRALDRAPGYGEARLGLGVILASRAERASTSREQRRLVLEAIGQCAAVRPADPVYPMGLFDRVVMLAHVGRLEEARRLAAQYRARAPDDPWGAELQALVAAMP